MFRRIFSTLIGLTLSSFVYGQLSLEALFLSDKYSVKGTEEIDFLHRSPEFARLFNTGKDKKITFYNYGNEPLREWKISWNANDAPVAEGPWLDLHISGSDQYFMAGTNCEQLYRRSFACSYFLGKADGRASALSYGRQYFPVFSPDERKLAFVRDNNLFYKDLESGKETDITQDGAWNTVINGKSDWVYEEEFELTRAFSWNNSGDRIAYLKFDESKVKSYSIPMYYDLQYPTLFTYKYPAVGEENARVSIWLYDLKSKKNRPLSIPYAYEYLPRMYWNAGSSELLLFLLNRHQDSLQIIAYNVKKKSTRIMYRESAKRYLELPFAFRILSDNSFIISSEQDGYAHLYHYDKDGKLLKQLTSGPYEVQELCGVQEQQYLLYFRSNEGNPMESAIYSLNYQNGVQTKLTQEAGSHKAYIAPGYRVLLHAYSSDSVPPRLSLRDLATGKEVLLEDNALLRDSLHDMPKKTWLKPPVKGDTLRAWIIRPASADSGRRCPLLMYVYGGPGDQQVLNAWPATRDLFFNYLATRGYAVACVDNRGTGGRGREFRQTTFLQLGSLESEDQLAAAHYFARLPYIDSSRISIFGWSYGAYLAARCLMEGDSIFRSAIAVDPVSDWNLYDDVYTERYMRTPGENPKGYYYSKLNTLVPALKGKLLLVQGTADDNVHLQHTLSLIQALNDQHKPYQLLLYPDKEHSLYGRNTRYDLFLRIRQFLDEP